MKCDAAALQGVMGMAMPIVSTAVSVEVYKCLRFAGSELHCTNHVSYGTLDLPAGMSFEEEVLVNAKQLDSIVKYLKGQVEIKVEPNRIVIEDDNGVFKVPRAQGVMAVPGSNPEDYVHANHMVPCLSAARSYTARGTHGIKAFEGIIVKDGDVIATDGDVMMHVDMDLEIGDTCVIPPAEVGVLHKATQTGFMSDTKRAYFKYANGVISTALIEAQCPQQIRSVIDNEWDQHFRVDKDDMHGAIRQCMSLATSEDATFIRVGMEAKDGKLSMNSSSEKGEVSVEIDCDTEHTMQCSVNGFFLNKFLSSASASQVGMSRCSNGFQGIRLRSRLAKACGDKLFDVFIGEVGEWMEKRGEEDEAAEGGPQEDAGEPVERF